MAGDNDTGRSHKGRPRSYVLSSTTEAFTVSRDEDTEGKSAEYLAVSFRSWQRNTGNAHLGEGYCVIQ